MAKVKQYKITCGMMEANRDTECLERQIEMMKKAEFINQYHTRKISYLEKKKMWCTRVDDGKKIYSVSYDGLIDKLFDYYGGVDDYSFRNIYQLAREEIEKTTKTKAKTTHRELKRFDEMIPSSLAKQDIRTFKRHQIMEFFNGECERYKREHNGELMPRNRFFAMKGIFRTTFAYATDDDHPIMDKNPYPTNNKVFDFDNSRKKPNAEKTIFSREDIIRIQRYLEDRVRQSTRYTEKINAYAILFSIETGMRVAELCALRWADIDNIKIHIHAQILNKDCDGKNNYYYEPSTKNEKGVSKGGRMFPQTEKIKSLLDGIRNLQEQNDVATEWVFGRNDGSWMTTDGYYECLYKVCREKLGLPITNNHAFRKALNSDVLAPKMSAKQRADLLGHSEQCNQDYYTLRRSDNDTMAELAALLDADGTSNSSHPVTPHRSPNIIEFRQKKKPSNPVNSRVSQK